MYTIHSLHIYPVKSLAGFEVESVTVHTRGLGLDRRWMIVNEAGLHQTQRQIPQMATIKTAIEDHQLILNAPKMQPLHIPINLDRQADTRVQIWSDLCMGVNEGDKAAKWLQKALKSTTPLRLICFPNTEIRPVDPNYLKQEKAHTGFSDGFPFLVTNTATLDFLNRALNKRNLPSVPMNRFRPNIVLAGKHAHEENQWKELTTEDLSVGFGVRKPCQRCLVTTVNQQTGKIEIPHEPLKTLVEINPFDHLKGGFFGQNLTLLKGEGECLSKGARLFYK